jgi:hypothetical protein
MPSKRFVATAYQRVARTARDAFSVGGARYAPPPFNALILCLLSRKLPKRYRVAAQDGSTSLTQTGPPVPPQIVHRI